LQNANGLQLLQHVSIAELPWCFMSQKRAVGPCFGVTKHNPKCGTKRSWTLNFTLI